MFPNHIISVKNLVPHLDMHFLDTFVGVPKSTLGDSDRSINNSTSKPPHSFIHRIGIFAPMISGLVLGFATGIVGLHEVLGCLLGILLGWLMRNQCHIAVLVFLILEFTAAWALFQEPYRGTHRWVEFGGQRVNIVLPLVACGLIIVTKARASLSHYSVAIVILITLLLQMAISIATVFFVSVVLSKNSIFWRPRILILVAAGVLVIFTILTSNNRISRLGAFFTGEAYQTRQTSKVLQSLECFSAAKRQFHLPAAKTDLALLHVGRQIGAIAPILHTISFIPLILLILQHQVHNSSNSDALIIVFMTVCILLNIGICLSLIPTIGLPAPFLGKGGSAWLCFSSLICFVYNNPSH